MAKAINIKSDKKSLIKRIILFVVFLLIAVISLTYGFSACSSQYSVKEGLERIKINSIRLPNNQIITPFEGEINFYFYVEKKKKQSPADHLALINKAYSQIAYETYLTLNSNFEFDEFVSIAYINNHPNTDIKVSDLLYNTLYDAYQKTIQKDSPYNVFAGQIADFWTGIVNDSSKGVDPEFHVTNRQRLEKMVESLKQKDQYRLEFNEENKTIKYVVSEEFKANLKLDLNVLYEAYAIQEMADYLLTYNFNKGYFVSKNGFFHHLKEYWSEDNKVQISTNLYLNNLEEERYDTLNISSFQMDKSVYGSTFTNYYLSSNDNQRYQIKNENKVIRRHPYFDAKTGYPITNIRYSRVYTNQENTKLADLGLDNLIMMTSTPSVVQDYVLEQATNQKGMMYIIDNGLLNDVIDENWHLYYKNISDFSVIEKYQQYVNKL